MKTNNVFQAKVSHMEQKQILDNVHKISVFNFPVTESWRVCAHFFTTSVSPTATYLKWHRGKTRAPVPGEQED